MADWGFYGRENERRDLEAILGRRRWFFARITGRRRIGKTTLVQQALAGVSSTERVVGFWDRGGTEIDLVAIDADNERLRLGTCKRSASRLLPSLGDSDGHFARFLEAFPRFASWKVERVALAPTLSADERARLRERGYVGQDLNDLMQGLR